MIDGFTIVPYDRERHERWVMATFEKSMREGADRLLNLHAARLEMRDYMRHPSTRTLVVTAADDPDVFAAWASAVTSTSTVLFAFTAKPCRRQGIMSDLLDSFPGMDISWETPVIFWTIDAASIARNENYRIYHLPRPRKEPNGNESD